MDKKAETSYVYMDMVTTGDNPDADEIFLVYAVVYYKKKEWMKNSVQYPSPTRYYDWFKTIKPVADELLIQCGLEKDWLQDASDVRDFFSVISEYIADAPVIVYDDAEKVKDFLCAAYKKYLGKPFDSIVLTWEDAIENLKINKPNNI